MNFPFFSKLQLGWTGVSCTIEIANYQPYKPPTTYPEDEFKNIDILKNNDNLKCEDNLWNEESIRIKTTLVFPF